LKCFADARNDKIEFLVCIKFDLQFVEKKLERTKIIFLAFSFGLSSFREFSGMIFFRWEWCHKAGSQNLIIISCAWNLYERWDQIYLVHNRILPFVVRIIEKFKSKLPWNIVSRQMFLFLTRIRNGSWFIYELPFFCYSIAIASKLRVICFVTILQFLLDLGFIYVLVRNTQNFLPFKSF